MVVAVPRPVAAHLGGSTALRMLAGLRDDEAFAVACYIDDARWLLLTDRRVVWTRDARLHEIPLDQLVDATVEADALRDAGSKALLSTLMLVTSDGRRTPIEVEAGAPFVGMWNALKVAAAGVRGGGTFSPPQRGT